MMISNRIKLFVIAAFVLPFTAISISNSGAVNAVSIADDTATTYTKSCKMCHGPDANKAFDPAKNSDEHVAIILDGKKGAKPPFMPAYKDKGMTTEQATALAEHMLQLNAAQTP